MYHLYRRFADMAKAIVSKGGGGYGTPLEISAEGKRTKVVCMTGAGIHPLAEKIAEVIGGEAVDGFRKPVPDAETACVIVTAGEVSAWECFLKKDLRPST